MFDVTALAGRSTSATRIGDSCRNSLETNLQANDTARGFPRSPDLGWVQGKTLLGAGQSPAC
ncbi:MAG: hypothetical protein WC222_02725 [Parachlamydiales bacterium]